MPHTTEAEYKKQIEDLRDLHRQAVESAQKAAEEYYFHFFSPNIDLTTSTGHIFFYYLLGNEPQAALVWL